MLTAHQTYPGQPATRTVSDDAVISFPLGLVGCAHWRRFVLLFDDHTPSLHLLSCLDELGVQLFVADPHQIVPAYRAEVSPGDLRAIGLLRPDDALVLCILTAHPVPPYVTANLLGPLVINPATRLGVQLVQLDSPYTTRHPLSLSDSTDSEAAACWS
ncbi:MAG: flagellar assembly protein FliW [Chloroflexi bacterium]|nr:flagellar assembly protein FliW [Chloroflexota bacterium]